MSVVTFDVDQTGWGSTEAYPDGTLLPFTLDKIVIHWGGRTDPDGPDDIADETWEAAVLRGWQRYHINSRGWVDIAYGFGFGNTGLVYRCRGFNRQGATSGDYDNDGIPENAEALSFVWIGGTAGSPSQAAYDSMSRAIRQVLAAYPNALVTVHSDHKATQCPGDEWRAWVDRRGWESIDEGDEMTYEQFAHGWFDSLSDEEFDLMAAFDLFEGTAEWWKILRDKGYAGRTDEENVAVVHFRNTNEITGWSR